MDKYDEQAAALLPGNGRVDDACLRSYRDAVAAKLRELEQKAFEQINTLCSDITDLHQQLAVLRNRVWDNGDLQRERDEARALLKEVPEIIRKEIRRFFAQDKEKADG